MSDNEAVALLRDVVESCRRSLEKTERRLQREIDANPSAHGLTPDDIQDMQGRPILLEARLQYAHALAVLVEHS